MDSINRASPPIYHSEASTSAAYSEPVSTPTLRPRTAIKRNLSSPIIFDDQEEKPVKKRKVQLAEKPNASKKNRQEAKAKHRLESEILRTKKRNAVKYVEQWLNTKGVNTDSLKQEDTTANKLAQYEKKLLDFKDNEIVNSCQDSLDELAKVLVDFNLEKKLKKKQKKKKLEINIENIKQLIQKTKKLKKHITVDEKTYAQLITLRSKISKQIDYDNSIERIMCYAKALYFKAELLMNDSLPKEEFAELNENMDLLGRFAGTTPKPTRKKQTDSNKWRSEKQEKIKEAFSRLEKILQEKYNVTVKKNSRFNLIHIANESVQKIKKHRVLPEKEYSYEDFQIFRINKSTERLKSNTEYNKEFRDKLNAHLIELQKNLGISIISRSSNADMEKTILAACEFLEKFEIDSQATSSTKNIDDEEFAQEEFCEERTAESTSARTSPGSEPLLFESACSPKNLHKIRKEIAYMELRETLKKWPAISPLPRDDRELICAAAYCTNSIYWKEPTTYEAYLKFRSSELASESHNDTPEESINTQLNSLKQKLIDASLHTEELSKKQGIEIIKAASEYLSSNEWHGSNY